MLIKLFYLLSSRKKDVQKLSLENLKVIETTLPDTLENTETLKAPYS